MILVGDVIEKLSEIRETVQTCVTSPPYWGLRDYGVEGQLGLEKTPQEFVANMVEVFRGVRRVLRDDGTLWLNIGDSYASQRGGTHQPAETLAGGVGGKTESGARVNRSRHDGYNPSRNASAFGLKHKDLCLIPERLAIALQDDGWWIRSRIAWCKKSSMPESVTDRPTSAWEHIWLLTKSARYYYDSDAVRQSYNPNSLGRYDYAKQHTNSTNQRYQPGNEKLLERGPVAEVSNMNPNGANLRNYWVLGPEPYPEAHFATFPSEIPRRCIKAGSRPRDTVLDPFLGSGTTAAVAQELDMEWVGIELNPEYAALAEKRINAVGAPQIGLPI